MIKTKAEYKEYVKCDRVYYANLSKSRLRLSLNKQYRYLKLMRKLAYLSNRQGFVFLRKLRKILLRLKFDRLALKLNYSIGINCFGKGLVLPHYGTIIINHDAVFGDNCVVQAGVNVSDGVRAGNHVYLAAGVKIIRNIHIGSDVIIGANAVVTHSFEEDNIILAGVPAKIISRSGYRNRENESI